MLESIKTKLTGSKLKPAPRLPKFNPFKDIRNPEDIHQLPPPEQWFWGTPNMNRREDVILTLSNYEQKITLLVRLKWRPAKEGNLVTLATRLTLILGYDHPGYEYENFETYVPSECSKREGTINQYGSFGSDFKLIHESACRRTRLVFRGFMTPVGNRDGERVFVRLSMVGISTTRFFDFKTEMNADFFAKQWNLRPEKCKVDLDEAINKLVFDDVQEQACRYVGELKVGHEGDSQELFMWGFNQRRFGQSPQYSEKLHVLGYLTNGQLFHLSAAKVDEEKLYMQTGYTCFGIRSSLKAMTKLVGQLDDELTHLEISNEGVDMELRTIGKYRKIGRSWISMVEVDFNGNEGFLYIYKDEIFSDISEDIFLLHNSWAAYEKLVEENAIARNMISITDESSLVLNAQKDDNCLDSDLVGGKAASLAQLCRLSEKEKSVFNVTNAIVVTKLGYDMILEQNKELRLECEELDKFLGSTQDHDAIKMKCDQLVAKFKQVKVPVELSNQLRAKLSPLMYHEAVPFAVRSSSWGEDTEDMSAAGQLATKLNVRGFDQIEAAIMECFASKYSAENVQYKRQHGLSPNLPMAVIVQSMVSCHKAGVMFTCDPISGDKSIITITANFGLGESVVNGEADPDHIRVKVLPNGELELIEAKPGRKSVVISEESEVHQWDRSNCCVDKYEILLIAECGRKVSKYFNGAPRDIEWGIHRNILYLFQARPITGLDIYTETELLHEADKASRAEDEWRSRVNLNEVFPYGISPFTLTYYVHSWNIIGARFIKQFDKTIDITPDGTSDVICDMYHNFFSLRRSFVFGMSDPEGANSHLMKSMEMGFFGHEVGPQPGIMRASKNIPSPSNPYQGLYFDLCTAPMRLAPVATTTRQYSLVRATEKMVKKAESNPNITMTKLYKLISRILANHGESLMTHFMVIFLGGYANQVLHAILSRHVKDPRELYAALNRFLGVAKNVVSAEIPKRIEKIANVLRSNGHAKEFAQMTCDDALTFLKGRPELAKLFEDFISGFGHRCYNEWEHRDKPWREDMKPVIEMLQRNCSMEQDSIDKIQRNSVASNDEIIDSLGVKFTSKERFLIRNMFAPRAQAFVAAREFSKDISIRYIDLERRICRKLAYEMQLKMRLPDTDLFYYLMFDEIEPVIRAPQPAIVSQALRRRQMFKREFGQLWKFDEIIPGYNTKPLHKMPQEELAEAIRNAPRIIGSPASSGSVQGPVRIIENYEQLSRIETGDILVTYSTDIAFSPIFPLISGIITEVGGLISHGAVVAREYGLPSLLGVVNATRILEDGERILLDANKGVIVRLSKEQQQEEEQQEEEK